MEMETLIATLSTACVRHYQRCHIAYVYNMKATQLCLLMQHDIAKHACMRCVQ